MDVNKIQVIDDDGNELELMYSLLLIVKIQEKNMFYYYDANDEDAQVYSSIYDDDGNLYPIETPDEWDMIEEVFNSFMAEDEEDENSQDMD